MAHYILHKEMDAIQWDGDNFESIQKVFGKDWILGKLPYNYDGCDYTGRDRGKYYIQLKNVDTPNHNRLIPLGQYVCRYKDSEEVFEMKEHEFQRENWKKDYEYMES